MTEKLDELLKEYGFTTPLFHALDLVNMKTMLNEYARIKSGEAFEAGQKYGGDCATIYYGGRTINAPNKEQFLNQQFLTI